jgi:Rrf2 family protein
MRVSAHADYALRAAIELAAVPDRHVTIEQLARAQDIPGTFLETILLHLRRSNIVRSRRGPDGGFWLARPASEISLADVIRAIDGQSLGVRGEPRENVTYPGPAEPLRRVWIALRAFGPTVLESVTLADIVSGELWLPARPAGPQVASGRRSPEGGAWLCPGNPGNKSGGRCRIGARVFVAGVSGRPRGRPRSTGDDPRCSTWFP